MAGLVFSSINDLPPSMRQQAAGKLLETVKAKEAGKGKAVKYHNVKVVADTIKFDSQKEYRRFLVLMEAQRHGIICDLRLQQNFTLIEGFTKPDGERVRPVVYKADFVYRVNDVAGASPLVVDIDDYMYWSVLAKGTLVIEDVKSQGTRTRVYINKMKLMAEKGYHIREV